jgi:hypothetical protein
MHRKLPITHSPASRREESTAPKLKLERQYAIGGIKIFASLVVKGLSVCPKANVYEAGDTILTAEIPCYPREVFVPGWLAKKLSHHPRAILNR